MMLTQKDILQFWDSLEELSSTKIQLLQTLLQPLWDIFSATNKEKNFFLLHLLSEEELTQLLGNVTHDHSKDMAMLIADGKKLIRRGGELDQNDSDTADMQSIESQFDDAN